MVSKRFGNNNGVSRRLLGDVFTEMNKVFDNGFTEGIIPMDIIEYDESFKISVAVPGFTRDQMTVKVEDGALVIKADKEVSEDATGTVLYKGLSSFNFARKIPNIEEKFKVDITAINSTYEQGILMISLPKKASALPQNVDIEVR